MVRYIRQYDRDIVGHFTFQILGKGAGDIVKFFNGFADQYCRGRLDTGGVREVAGNGADGNTGEPGYVFYCYPIQTIFPLTILIRET